MDCRTRLFDLPHPRAASLDIAVIIVMLISEDRILLLAQFSESIVTMFGRNSRWRQRLRAREFPVSLPELCGRRRVAVRRWNCEKRLVVHDSCT